MECLKMSLKDKGPSDRLLEVEKILQEISPHHINLHILMTYQLAKLFLKVSAIQDESSEAGLAKASQMSHQAHSYLRKSIHKSN